MSKDPRKGCPEKCARYEEDLNTPCLKGVGPSDAKIMLVGENPGKHEDKKGKPFIGRSGKLLDEILLELDIDRAEVYVTNAVKCFTLRDDTKPTDPEIRCCRPYLKEEIERIKPNVICGLGATALKALLGKTGIKKFKNNVFMSEEFGVKVVPTYHPAWVLRNPGDASYLRRGLELALSEAGSSSLVQRDKVKTKYLVADSKAKVEKVLTQLENVDVFAFDLETTSLSFLSADVLCISFSWQVGLGVVVPWDRLTGSRLHRLKAIMLSDKLKIGQNLKFDIKMLLAQGVSIKKPFFDTMTAHHIIDENSSHDLETLTLHYLDLGEYWLPLEKQKVKIAKERGIKKSDVTYDMFPRKILYKYAGQDADATFRLYKILSKELKRQDLGSFYKKYTLPYMPVLIEMEYRGFLVDREKLAKLVKEYNKKLDANEKDLCSVKDIGEYELARKKAQSKKLISKYNDSKMIKSRYPDGADQYIEKMLKDKDWVFNFKSPKQLSELLFDQMGIEPLKKTKTGYSTDEEVLKMLALDGVEIAEKIIDHRKLAKYISTYIVSAYEKSVKDGRIHPNYLQIGTVSGRLSCKDPNMQNIPREAKDFKECFVSDPGYTIVKADLAQAEFRCWAHYSEDEDMLNDIHSGLDIHTVLASEVFDVPEEEIDKKDPRRTAAKNAVFGLMYGRGSAAIAEQYGISLEKAKEIKESFFERYPVAAEWLTECVAKARAYGHVKTWFGRYRRLPGIESDNKEVRAEAERQAKNSPIQGQVSDMNNAYMVMAMKYARKRGIDCFPAGTVHDANIIQVRDEHVSKLIKLMGVIVRDAYPDFKCEMLLDFDVGKTLGTLKEVA